MEEYILKNPEIIIKSLENEITRSKIEEKKVFNK